MLTIPNCAMHANSIQLMYFRMETLKYTVIKTQQQYNEYCNLLEEYLSPETPSVEDDIALLSLLIETWDRQHNIFTTADPIQLIKALMEEHQMKAADLATLLGLSKGTVSKILNYRKGLSKSSIRILAQHFKVSQEALNVPYALVAE